MRKSIVFIAGFTVVCLLFLSPCLLEAEILKFKMTDKVLPVPPGFTRVTGDTNYTEELGYGWSEGPRVEWRTSNFGSNPGREIMTGTFPDVITGSWVAPGKFVGTSYVSRQFDFKSELEFMVKVPPGKYGVYLILGDFYWSYGYMDYLRTPYAVSVNGKEVLFRALTEKEAADLFYAHEYDDYDPGISYWRKYVKPYFDRTSHRLEAVSDGTIRLAVRNIPITMIALWPEEETVQAEAWLKKLEADREQSCELKEKTRPVLSAFSVTEEQKQQGYVLFAVDYMEDVLPWTTPDANALQSELQLFAAQNETEPVTFGILPLRDLRDVRVTVGDLKDATGNLFSSRNIDVQWAKYTECHLPSGSLYYEIKPTILVHRDSATVYNGVAKQVWVFFSVPSGTRSGIYTGDVTVSASNALSLRKKITLRVLPFRLKTLTELDKYIDLTMSYIYYRHPGIWPGTDKMEMTRKLIKGWADYGFNVGQADFSVISTYGTRDYKLVDGKVVVDFANCEKWLKGWEDAGVTLKAITFSNMLNNYTQTLINKKAPGYRATKNEVTTFPKEYDSVYIDLAQMITRGFAQRGWPFPIFFEGGEGGGYEEGRYFEKHVHGLLYKAGVKNSLALSGDFSYFKEIVPLLWAPFDYNFNLERYEWMKKHKSNMFFKAEFRRFERGLYFWRIGALGHHAESYCYAGFGDPYNMFGSPWRAGGLSSPSRDGNGIHPTIELERDVREGHDDARYLFQLEQLIEEVKKTGTKEQIIAAEESAEMLEKLREGVNPDLEYYRRVAFPSPTIYSKIRWRVAREIMKLNDLLQK